MSDLGVALAGGAVGSVLTATLTQIGRIRLAWAEVALHDAEAEERNRQLVAWVDDETLKLVREMAVVTQDHNARGVLYSSLHGGDLADRKAGALHRYRDQEWRAQLFLSELQASEGLASAGEDAPPAEAAEGCSCGGGAVPGAMASAGDPTQPARIRRRSRARPDDTND